MSGKIRWRACDKPLLAITVIVFASFLANADRLNAGNLDSTHSFADNRELAQPQNSQPGLDASVFDRLLHTYVSDEGWVDYAGLARERGALNHFLDDLGKASRNDLKTKEERLAFWINAYNAFTLADALDTVYGKHQSVRQVGGFFDGRKHHVAGEQLTLDEIEKQGRDLHDPRIHFTIVCASTSCPKLQRFAYTGEKLNNQLDQAASQFFADQHRGLRFDPKNNELYVSPILKWYAGDFTGTSGNAESVWARVKATVSGNELLQFIAHYAPPEVGQHIKDHSPTLHYFDYDWSLNAQDSHVSGNKP